MSKIVEIKNVYKDFKKGKESVSVLKGVNMSVNSGEIVSIVGPSGAGKSTLLNIIGTLMLPTLGEVNIGGESLMKKRDSYLSNFRSKNLGFVFQNHLLLPEFTAVENIALNAVIAGKSFDEALDMANDLLSTLSLSHRANHYPNELSGGEQQRVSVARAVINSPKVLLADEPTGNLDRKNSNDIKELFLKLNKEKNQTIIYVTHDEHVEEISHRTIKLVDGLIEDIKE